MSRVDIARKELEAAGLFDADADYNGAIGEAVMELMQTFENQNHSGFSAMLTLNLFERLSKGRPLTPLTGKDWEWQKAPLGEDESENEQLYVNIRCPYVVKYPDGTVYNTEAKVFSEDGIVWYTNKDSKIPITFPYSVPNEPVRVIIGKDND